MKSGLVIRSLRDGWLLLAGCATLTLAVIYLRVWFTSRIKIEHFLAMLADGLKLFQNLLPVTIDEWASPLGRTAFSFEEPTIVLLLGLWTVARGSECIAGRVASGTMEMLLAQPVGRLTLVATHSAASLWGVAVMAAAGFGGVAGGLAVSQFERRPAVVSCLPAAVNYFCFGVFLLGAATLISSLAKTRAQAVSFMVAFYVLQMATHLAAKLAPGAGWLENFTMMSIYEPTLLATGLARSAEEYWPQFWKLNGALLALGAVAWSAGAAVFCHRDVPAPL